MKRLLLLLALTLAIVAQENKEQSEAWRKGLKMSRKDAADAEKRLAKKTADLAVRTQLIAFYTHSDQVDVPTAIAERRKHLLWMAQEQPTSPLWTQASNATKVYIAGGRLPDPEGFAQIREVWLKHLAVNPSDARIRDNAASFLELGDRQTALRLFRQSKSPLLGDKLGVALLGVTARDFIVGDALAADPTVRESDLGKEIMAELDRLSDPQIVGLAGTSLARHGGMLWLKGIQHWDYSQLAKNLLARAQAFEPNRLQWFVPNPELPKPGEIRAPVFQVGGMVMANNAVSKTVPEVPPELRGITGTVVIKVIVGTDGRITKAVPESGPLELYEISIKAVEQWVYQPSRLNGAPIPVITTVAFKYE